MNDVEIYDDIPRVGSYSLAEALERDHDHIRKLVERYRVEFEDFSDLKIRKLRSTGGRAANEYMLDEDQFMFLGTLLRNNAKVVKFKLAIISSFKKCRKELEAVQRYKTTEPRYQITRDAGKLVRKSTTDSMKKFVEYAKTQGSNSPDHYYSNITKMMNTTLFVWEGKFKNIRDTLSVQQLMTVSTAEQIINRALLDGMSRKKYYKDIYQDVKSKVILFVELHGASDVVDKAIKDLPE